MFDQEYFSAVLPKQIAMISRKAAAEVSLHSGVRYHVHEVKEVHGGYVWLQIYPPEGTDIQVKQDLEAELRAGRSGFNTDEVAIAYEAIAEVRVFEAPGSAAHEIGFRPQLPARARTSRPA